MDGHIFNIRWKLIYSWRIVFAKNFWCSLIVFCMSVNALRRWEYLTAKWINSRGLKLLLFFFYFWPTFFRSSCICFRLCSSITWIVPRSIPAKKSAVLEILNPMLLINPINGCCCVMYTTSGWVWINVQHTNTKKEKLKSKYWWSFCFCVFWSRISYMKKKMKFKIIEEATFHWVSIKYVMKMKTEREREEREIRIKESLENGWVLHYYH